MSNFDYYGYRSAIAKNDNERKIKYVIDESKRTIVCYMTNCRYDAIDALRQMGVLSLLMTFYTENDTPETYLNSDKLEMNDTYRGKAKCHPNDDWDVEEGMRIARNRMLATYYMARFRKLVLIEDKIQKLYETIKEKVDYCDTRATKALQEKL